VTETILAAQAWATNAELIADCARLGYLTGRVLDPTYGRGKWWTAWCPDGLVAHDLKTDGVDFRHLPHPDESFDAIAFDPPYKLNGTPTDKVDAPYGVDVVDTRDGRHQLIRDGITECKRVLALDGHLLVKCQDQVNGGKVRWQTHEFTGHAQTLGLRLVDAFLILGHREQPAGTRQVHARRNYSTLLVFRKAKARTIRPDATLL
jgi:SAM-dependent methyltransferase